MAKRTRDQIVSFRYFFPLESIDVLYAYTHLSVYLNSRFFPQLLLVFHILFISSLNSLITECSGCHLLTFRLVRLFVYVKFAGYVVIY